MAKPAAMAGAVVVVADVVGLVGIEIGNHRARRNIESKASSI
jgi:hypothetical protein